MKTYEEVRQILSAIEPTEEMYSKLTADDVQHLQRMVHEPDAWRAARAVHAASRLHSVAANQLVLNASKDGRRELRAAAAAAAPRMSLALGNEVLGVLLDDHDHSIKKLAIKSVGRGASPAILGKLKALSEDAADASIKQLAGKQLQIAH